MDLHVKKYIFAPIDEKNIYISRNLDDILERSGDYGLICVYAVVELANGDTLFDMSETYAGEPYIRQKFMHFDSFIGFHPHHKIINI